MSISQILISTPANEQKVQDLINCPPDLRSQETDPEQTSSEPSDLGDPHQSLTHTSLSSLQLSQVFLSHIINIDVLEVKGL